MIGGLKRRFLKPKEVNMKRVNGIINVGNIICLVFFLVVLLFVGHARSAPEKQIVLRLAHEGSATSSRQMTGLKLVELTNKYTSGRLKIEIYPSATLVPAAEQIRATQVGTVDMSFITAGTLPAPSFSIFYLPFLFQDQEHCYRFEDHPAGGLKMLKEELPKHALMGLWILETGRGGFISTKPIKTIDDFKGVKWCSTNPSINTVFEVLGASTVQVASGDAYVAFQQGVANGRVTNLTIAVSSRWHEVAKYWLEYPVNYAAVGCVMNLDKWNSLPADIRTALMTKVFPEVREYGKKFLEKEEVDARKTFTASGGAIIPGDWFAAQVKPMLVEQKYPKWVPKIGKEYIELANSLKR